TLTVNYSTIFDNNASELGGSIRSNGAVTLNGSILAGSDSPTECSGTAVWTDQGYNIVGDATCPLTEPSSMASTDPMLEPLADNGGPTFTHVPMAAGPAVGAIPPGVNGCGTTYAYDQRGVGRPQHDMGDIGAHERDGAYVGMGLDDAYTVVQSLVLNVAAPGVLANDLHGPSTVALDDDVDNGTLTLNSDGSFEYEPFAAFSGLDSFTYTATGPEFSDTATVIIDVLPANCAVEIHGDAT
ncbi:MAG: hypothetical protein GY720_01475, partial [bacterium]|nr:hypothetical protein [bacterium]